MDDVAFRPRTSLSLCTGYGGIELALRLACPGIRLVGAVERQAYAAAVLASRMDEGALDSCPIWDDLETFPCDAYRGRVDLVTAGFPCQGASVAGKRLGVEDERWLWPEVWRITCEVEATWLFVENVTGLLSVNGGRAFEEILRDLASRGWSARWDCVPAGAVGAPHVRDRVFLLAADSHRVGVRVESERDQRQGRRERETKRGHSFSDDTRAQGPASNTHGGGRGTRRRPVHEGQLDVEVGDQDAANSACLGRDEGTPVAPGAGRQGGPDATGGDQPAGAKGHDSDTDLAGFETERYGWESNGMDGQQTHRSDADRHRGSRLGHRNDIVAIGRDHWRWDRAPFPTIRGMDDGSSMWLGGDSYTDELHLLGNGAAPQQCAVAFVLLWERLHGDEP
jgi:C-5 cytosine-specific DNA methylase